MGHFLPKTTTTMLVLAGIIFIAYELLHTWFLLLTVHENVHEQQQQQMLSAFSVSQLNTNNKSHEPKQQQNYYQEEQQRPKVLVVYGGPTSMMTPEELETPQNLTSEAMVKRYKYHLNFEYFLKYGVDCQAQDTLIVVSDEVHHEYQERIQQIDAKCRHEYNHRVLLMTRQPRCLDLEAVRVAVYESHNQVGVNVSSYDYFFYVNCGVSGPSRHFIDTTVDQHGRRNRSWTDLFMDKLVDGVKMTGLSMHCIGPPHIQSMMYAMDQQALQVLMQSDVFFDCEKDVPGWFELPRLHQHGRIVNRYERGMSNELLSKGYGIAPHLRPKTIFEHNKTECKDNDLWMGSHLKNITGNGRMPFLNETIFFKSTRYLTQEVADEIGYKAAILHNWE